MVGERGTDVNTVSCLISLALILADLMDKK